MAKRYYWLKLDKDFFKRHDIRIIENMENGKDYILFYLKLLVESVSHNGRLRFSDAIPYNESMLATVTNTNVDIVRAAMKVFRELKMLEIMDDETLYLTEVQKMVGSETDVAGRVRKCRERKVELLQCNADVTESNNMKQICNTESESDIDIEIDIESETSSIPTKEEVYKYAREKKSDVDVDRFYEYHEKKNWQFDGTPIHHWKRIFDKWDQIEQNRSPKTKKKYAQYIQRDAVPNSRFGMEYLDHRKDDES